MPQETTKVDWRKVLKHTFVILIAIAVLSFVFTNALLSMRGHDNRPRPLNNGKNIYVSIFAWTIENPSHILPWPKYGTNSADFEFQTSTEFFRHFVDIGGMNVDYSFFSLPGLKSARTTNATEFTDAHNAWCITANVTVDTPDGVPVLFTRNINVTNVSQFTGSVADTLINEDPYGLKGAVVVMQGGAVTIVRPDQKWETALHLDSPPENMPVLRP